MIALFFKFLFHIVALVNLTIIIFISLFLLKRQISCIGFLKIIFV